MGNSQDFRFLTFNGYISQNSRAATTAEEAVNITNSTSGNNAATVSDVLNSGWNLQNNGEARDFVKNL